MGHYVFLTNNMYASSSIRRVRWWNRLFGFPGRTVVATAEIDVDLDEDDAYGLVRHEFAEIGLIPQLMGREVY